MRTKTNNIEVECYGEDYDIVEISDGKKHTCRIIFTTEAFKDMLEAGQRLLKNLDKM